MKLNEELKIRREYFNKIFPKLKIGKKRVDVNSGEILKNSCPVCGYLTLNERDSFEICSICFWEDDGIDDFEVDVESGPNHMTLNYARKEFYFAKEKILLVANDNSLKGKVKLKFLKLDGLIAENSLNKEEVMNVQNELISILTNNKIYGIGKLIE